MPCRARSLTREARIFIRATKALDASAVKTVSRLQSHVLPAVRMIDPQISEWISQILRWIHVITAIAWIGSSFYFIHSISA